MLIIHQFRSDRMARIHERGLLGLGPHSPWCLINRLSEAIWIFLKVLLFGIFKLGLVSDNGEGYKTEVVVVVGGGGHVTFYPYEKGGRKQI